jgi:hypothetical protein
VSAYRGGVSAYRFIGTQTARCSHYDSHTAELLFTSNTHGAFEPDRVCGSHCSRQVSTLCDCVTLGYEGLQSGCQSDGVKRMRQLSNADEF